VPRGQRDGSLRPYSRLSRPATQITTIKNYPVSIRPNYRLRVKLFSTSREVSEGRHNSLSVDVTGKVILRSIKQYNMKANGRSVCTDPRTLTSALVGELHDPEN
jgi:hypothetical protein